MALGGDQPETAGESVEDAAVRIVVAMERRLGREARDVRKRREVADLESGGRLIEVKAFAGSFKPRLGSLLFTPQELMHARNNEAYYVYLVENVRSPAKVEVRILHGEHLRRVVNDPRRCDSALLRSAAPRRLRRDAGT